MAEQEELKGDALKQRAAELNIEGRGDMSADQLREAVAEADPNPVGAAVAAPAPEPPASRERQAYSVERLIEEAPSLTGYPRDVVAGALVGRTKPMTRDAAVAAVEKDLDREVLTSAQQREQEEAD